MKAMARGLIILLIIGIGSVGLGATKETGVEGLIQQGPGLIAQGEYKQLLSSISALPVQSRNDIRVRCLECFANLSAWRKTNADSYKAAWMALRQKLMYAGESEVTPVLICLLQDKEPFVREYAAELLGYCGDRRALAALQAGKADNNRGVGKYAGWAHKQIADGLTPFTANLPPLAAPHAQIPVAMDTAGPIATGKSVSLVNGTEDFKITLLGTVSGDYPLRNCYADLETWTDITIEQLETELQKRGVRVVVPGGADARRVVIGVLNTSGSISGGEKKDLMEKLGQKPLVRLCDIPAYDSLEELQKNGYEKAAGYARNYPADMLLHIDRIGEVYNFSLIDLTAKVMQTASLTAEMGSFDQLTDKQLRTRVLADPFIHRVLRAKKKAAAAAARSGIAGDLVFSIWVKEAVVRDMVVSSRCYGIVPVKQQNGAWSENYPFNNVGADAERAIDGVVYRVVAAMLKDPAFRRALAP
jgi:hypothetical protein